VLNELAWNNSQIKFKFKTFFEDLNGNFVQDGNEPSIINCSDLALGTYSVYIKYIFYIDSGPAGYDAGDTMTQVETSNPVTFGLENTPYINRLNPKQVSKLRRLRVIGQNFGPQQTTGNVYVGTGSHYNLMVATPTVDKGKIQDKVKLWSNTKVMVNFRVRNTWKGTNKWVWVLPFIYKGKANNDLASFLPDNAHILCFRSSLRNLYLCHSILRSKVTQSQTQDSKKLWIVFQSGISSR
jgi:hypothetical protein